MVGGFLVGVLENLLGAYVVIGNELKLTVALVLIIGVLLVKPSGLFGRAVVTARMTPRSGTPIAIAVAVTVACVLPFVLSNYRTLPVHAGATSTRSRCSG